MKRTVSRMRHSTLQRHFFKIENCWFRFLGVKLFSSRRCFSVGEMLLVKVSAKTKIMEKHKKENVSAYYKKISRFLHFVAHYFLSPNF